MESLTQYNKNSFYSSLIQRNYAWQKEKPSLEKARGFTIPSNKIHNVQYPEESKKETYSPEDIGNLSTKFKKIAEKVFSFDSNKNPYYLVGSDDGRWIGVSRIQVLGSEAISLFKEIVSSGHNPKIHINTGTHGTPMGDTCYTAYKQEVRDELLGSEMVSNDFDDPEVLNYANCSINAITHKEIAVSLEKEGNKKLKPRPPLYPREAQFIIDAFCYSAFALEKIPDYPDGCEKSINDLLKQPQTHIEKNPKNPETPSIETPRNILKDAFQDQKNLRLVGGDSQWQGISAADRLEQINQAALGKIQLKVNIGSGYRFGAREWQEHFGVTVAGDETTFKDFDNIRNVLGDPCPFYKTKKVWETHLMTLIPKDVTLKNMKQYIAKPVPKEDIPHGYVTSGNRVYFEGNKEAEHNWVLVTKDVIPNSKNKTFQEQKDLLDKSVGNKYTVPKARDLALSILCHHVRSGEFLYSQNPFTYTRTEDLVDNKWRVFVGGFGSGGLHVIYYNFDDYRYEYRGLGALRKF